MNQNLFYFQICLIHSFSQSDYIIKAICLVYFINFYRSFIVFFFKILKKYQNFVNKTVDVILLPKNHILYLTMEDCQDHKKSEIGRPELL